MSSFARPTRQQLIDRDRTDFNARVPGADSRLRRSVLGGIATAHAGAMDGAYGDLDYIADQIMPDTADLAHLLRWAAIWGINPEAATAAAGPAASTGVSTNGETVPAGSVLQRGDGFTYATTADATVAGGVVTVQVTASAPGAAGEADAGVILTLVEPIAGIVPTFNVGTGGLVGGNDAEQPASILSRLLARIQNPPKGGGPGDYEQWAREIPGVTRAWELPLWMGLGTVGLAFVFDGREDIFPTGDDVAAMQAWLASKCPVEATVYAFAPTPLAINFVIQLSPNTVTVQNEVSDELADFFLRTSVVGSSPVLLKSQYDQAISLAEGETDHVVTTPAGNIYPGAGQLAVLGTITWAG